MTHLDRLVKQTAIVLFAQFVAGGLLAAGAFWLSVSVLHIPKAVAGTVIAATLIGAAAVLSLQTAKIVTDPTKRLWQAILHMSPDRQDTPAPDLDHIFLGKELVTSLALQVYQLASSRPAESNDDHRKSVSQAAAIVDKLPLPVFVCNKEQTVVNASHAALQYLGIDSSQLFGKPLFDSLDLTFPSEDTLEKWVLDCQANKVTDEKHWQRIRLMMSGGKEIKQLDIAASYNRDNALGTEFIITLEDQTVQYDREDQSVDFIALAVHELRTPLTLLRGYIEVFEEEFAGKLDPELNGFMHKMQAASQTLTAFVSNVLNVSRIETDQLVLKLKQESWPEIIQQAVDDFALRAAVHQKTIEVNVAAGLPPVGVDRVSAYEVIANLLDNAIKYSGQGPNKIIINAVYNAQSKLVETTVQDFGVGINSSVLPNLFERFYRNHRTMSQIGGTGLGLYLSKAIVEAHGGNIWVNSTEGRGSSFTFTVQPFDQLGAEAKASENTEITRRAHGWIKNHSLYRR
jgi:signal transduction histidine kinase